jgi:hypothetical protein
VALLARCALLLIWRKSRINFSFLLELPDNGRTEADNVASASLHTLLFSVSMLLFWKIHHHDILDSPPPVRRD